MISCVTIATEIEDFKRIRIGNEKIDVVEIVGNPNRKERKHDRDWWYYQFYYNGKKFNRLVVFENGRVIYAGRVTAPKYEKDANVIDQQHEISNKGLEMLPPPAED